MPDTSPRAPQYAVLFVCVKNGGKSQMAAGLMRHVAGERIAVTSAGTAPGTSINALSATVLDDLGIDIRAETPTLLTEEAMRAADLVVVLGTEATLPTVDDVRVEVWDIDEPSRRGIEGRERMERVRDDIHARVRELAHGLRATHR